jgi:hypothetical protein
MKNKILTALLCILLIPSVALAAAPNNFFATCLIGGTTGCLDAIDITNDSIANGDGAVVKTASFTYFFNYNSTSGVAESSPDTIAPDNDGGAPYAGNGRWERNTTYANTVYETYWIPASAMISLSTNGASPGSNEYATNDIMFDYYAFDGATEQYVAFNLPLRENWDRSTIKVKFLWTPGDSACTAGDTVEWEFAGIAFSDDDSIDTAAGGNQVISDTVLAGKDGDLHISGATPAMTISGTPALGDLIHFKASRNVGGTDDMTEDAWLFGAFIQIKKTQAVTAW